MYYIWGLCLINSPIIIGLWLATFSTVEKVIFQAIILSVLYGSLLTSSLFYLIEKQRIKK